MIDRVCKGGTRLFRATDAINPGPRSGVKMDRDLWAFVHAPWNFPASSARMSETPS